MSIRDTFLKAADALDRWPFGRFIVPEGTPEERIVEKTAVAFLGVFLGAMFDFHVLDNKSPGYTAQAVGAALAVMGSNTLEFAYCLWGECGRSTRALSDAVADEVEILQESGNKQLAIVEQSFVYGHPDDRPPLGLGYLPAMRDWVQFIDSIGPRDIPPPSV